MDGGRTTKRRRMGNIIRALPGHLMAIDDGNYAYATASITLYPVCVFDYRERGARTTHDGSYCMCSRLPQEFFEPNVFMGFKMIEARAFYLRFSSLSSSTMFRPRKIKYFASNARVSSSVCPKIPKHRAFFFGFLFAIFANNDLAMFGKTIKKCVCNAQQPGMRWHLASWIQRRWKLNLNWERERARKNQLRWPFARTAISSSKPERKNLMKFQSLAINGISYILQLRLCRIR